MSNHKSEQIGENDLIFYTVGENVYSGGFSVDSMLMKGGISPLMSISDNKNNTSASDNEEQVGGIFGNLVIPPMWFFSPSSTNSQQGGKRNNFEDEDDDDEIEPLSEDLHDKLLKLIEVAPNRRKKGTAKVHLKSNINKRTRKLKRKLSTS